MVLASSAARALAGPPPFAQQHDAHRGEPLTVGEQPPSTEDCRGSHNVGVKGGKNRPSGRCGWGRGFKWEASEEKAGDPGSWDASFTSLASLPKASAKSWFTTTITIIKSNTNISCSLGLAGGTLKTTETIYRPFGDSFLPAQVLSRMNPSFTCCSFIFFFESTHPSASDKQQFFMC